MRWRAAGEAVEGRQTECAATNSDYAQYYAHPVHGEGVTACYVGYRDRQQAASGKERVATADNRYAHS